MIRYYLFLASSPINRDSFEHALSSVSEDKLSFTYLSDNEGYFKGDDKLASTLQQLLFNIHDMLSINFSIVVAHKRGEFEEKMLVEALTYYPNQCFYLSDILLKEVAFGNYSSIPSLAAEFKNIDPGLLLTAGTFLRCGLNGLLTAKTLYVHRNTFNYRLNNFIEQTELDIRDYHNALLLELYFQFTNKG